MVGQVYALYNGTGGEKIIEHNKHYIERDDKIPRTPRFSPFKTSPAVIERSTDQANKNEPEV